ncbi:hypothetical protein LCGC14_0975670 [marine sediment metagenome]|uniref:Uncharacterized protein n=1 Tax=marine sediment metagenome TaxID=412755 RepID=A0A0F9RGS6_9ZZZZ
MPADTFFEWMQARYVRDIWDARIARLQARVEEAERKLLMCSETLRDADEVKETAQRERDEAREMHDKRVDELMACEAQVSGMQEEGCAARGLLENIFNGLTTRGTPVDPVLAQMAEAAAKLLVEVTVCKHKALAEQRKEALEKLGCERALTTHEGCREARARGGNLKRSEWCVRCAAIEEEEK